MDELTKILLVILGFLLGVSAQIIVEMNRENRKKVVIRDLMRTEVEAFIKACENAGKTKNWDSSAVETVSSHIIQSYSGALEEAYKFISLKRLSADFIKDIENYKRRFYEDKKS